MNFYLKVMQLQDGDAVHDRVTKAASYLCAVIEGIQGFLREHLNTAAIEDCGSHYRACQG